MLRDLPRDRPITVEAIMGDGEAAEFALLVHAFLKANGFTMAGEGISHRVAEVPPINQTVEPNNAGGLSFIVGPFRP